MQSPLFPRYLVPPRSKYSPQHHVLKHPQLRFLPQCPRPSYTPIQNNRQNYVEGPTEINGETLHLFVCTLRIIFTFDVSDGNYSIIFAIVTA